MAQTTWPMALRNIDLPADSGFQLRIINSYYTDPRFHSSPGKSPFSGLSSVINGTPKAKVPTWEFQSMELPEIGSNKIVVTENLALAVGCNIVLGGPSSGKTELLYQTSVDCHNHVPGSVEYIPLNEPGTNVMGGPEYLLDLVLRSEHPIIVIDSIHEILNETGDRLTKGAFPKEATKYLLWLNAIAEARNLIVVAGVSVQLGQELQSLAGSVSSFSVVKAAQRSSNGKYTFEMSHRDCRTVIKDPVFGKTRNSRFIPATDLYPIAGKESPAYTWITSTKTNTHESLPPLFEVESEIPRELVSMQDGLDESTVQQQVKDLDIPGFDDLSTNNHYL